MTSLCGRALWTTLRSLRSIATGLCRRTCWSLHPRTKNKSGVGLCLERHPSLCLAGHARSTTFCSVAVAAADRARATSAHLAVVAARAHTTAEPSPCPLALAGRVCTQALGDTAQPRWEWATTRPAIPQRSLSTAQCSRLLLGGHEAQELEAPQG